ncbi:protease-associated domain-containing family protein [Dorcoceras hygrometricum]|uniref:Protease-associated domain-containing family protein n=1 Tax=Dorcoceras hygrometricum TaxID=472368 RepID=A0A2Z7BIN0_9LAMI|nr:protease-associated domain-containing family protein [Dorcoceras hygrometricum]
MLAAVYASVLLLLASVDACFEYERVTPAYLISLLGSVSHYERSYHGYSAGRGVDPVGGAAGAAMLTWISVVGVLARITVASDQLLTSAAERSHALRLLVCESAVGSEVTCSSATSFGDMCCSDFVVAAVCVLIVAQELVSCCSRPVVTAVLILPGCEGERQCITLISLLVTDLCCSDFVVAAVCVLIVAQELVSCCIAYTLSLLQGQSSKLQEMLTQKLKPTEAPTEFTARRRSSFALLLQCRFRASNGSLSPRPPLVVVAAMLTWISVVGVLARITVASDQLLTSAAERSHALRLLVCESAVGSEVTCSSATSFGDMCCSDFVVAAVCVLIVAQELVSCCSRPVVTAVLILPGCEGERKYITLISLLVWCKDERVILVCLYTHPWPPFFAEFVVSCSPYWGLSPRSLWGCCVVCLFVVQVFQVIPLAVSLTHLEVPQE